MIGFFNFYKPEAISSFGALAKLRKLTGEKKLGHCGTLDPMATGVLPVAFGRAAKFIEFLPDNTKEYIAAFQLGICTDTLDRTGKVLEKRPVRATEAQVKQVLLSFLGESDQLPPMYSAVSRNGVRLYELARQGLEVDRQPRRIRIDQIELLETLPDNTYRIRVCCRKGTYIRSLIADVGEKLGCGAVMTALERTASNGFFARNALTLSDVQAAVENQTLNDCVVPVWQALDCYPKITVSQAQAKRVQNGGSLALNRLPKLPVMGYIRIFAPDGSFLAIGETVDQDVKMKKLYAVSE